MKKCLPGVNIQYPISEQILSGTKTIETRTYPLPSTYLNRDLFFIETPGEEGDFEARIAGIIRFDSCFQYTSRKEFYADLKFHLVDKDSKWAWKEKNKWAWHISHIERFKKNYDAPPKKGIVFTKEINIELGR